jgi:hypothetical protein
MLPGEETQSSLESLKMGRTHVPKHFEIVAFMPGELMNRQEFGKLMG